MVFWLIVLGLIVFWLIVVLGLIVLGIGEERVEEESEVEIAAGRGMCESVDADVVDPGVVLAMVGGVSHEEEGVDVERVPVLVDSSLCMIEHGVDSSREDSAGVGTLDGLCDGVDKIDDCRSCALGSAAGGTETILCVWVPLAPV